MSSVGSAVMALEAAYEELAAAELDTLTPLETLEVLDGLERLTRRLPTQSHRMIAKLRDEATPAELGAKSLRDVLAIRLRISRAEGVSDGLCRSCMNRMEHDLCPWLLLMAMKPTSTTV